MLKGSEFPTALALLMTLFLVAAIFSFLNQGYGDVTALRVGAEKTIDAFDTTRSIKGCLEYGGPVTVEKLDSIDDIQEFCNVGLETYVTIVDLDNPGNKWVFGEKLEGAPRSVAVSLVIEEGVNHFGELNVVI